MYAFSFGQSTNDRLRQRFEDIVMSRDTAKEVRVFRLFGFLQHRWRNLYGERLRGEAQLVKRNLRRIPQDALTGLEHLVTDAVSDMRNNHEQIPVPLADRPYSGRFNVRVPETLHRRLATEAAEQGVSLNRLISERLART